MKKLLISLLTMVIALSSMAGCVDKESEQSNNNSTQEVSTEESITEVTEVSAESIETSIQESDISAASDEMPGLRSTHAPIVLQPAKARRIF